MSTDDSDDTTSASGRLFDLRELIAGLFFVFGVILVIVGAFDNQAELDKAAGVRINLWTGIGMILLALVFVAWFRWKPLRKEDVVAAEEPAADEAAAPQDPISGH